MNYYNERHTKLDKNGVSCVYPEYLGKGGSVGRHPMFIADELADLRARKEVITTLLEVATTKEEEIEIVSSDIRAYLFKDDNVTRM